MIDYGRIYKDIMNLDRYVPLTVEVCTRHREGVKNLLSPEERNKSLERAIILEDNRHHQILIIA